MGLNARKSVLRVSFQIIPNFKPACSATETTQKIEISLVGSSDMILSNQLITKALIRLGGYAGWSAPLLFTNSEDIFSRVEAHIYPDYT